jgi:hypothetical protein
VADPFRNRVESELRLSVIGRPFRTPERGQDQRQGEERFQWVRPNLDPPGPPNALVQLQAHYHDCGEAASEKCLPAATFVRRLL